MLDVDRINDRNSHSERLPGIETEGPTIFVVGGETIVREGLNGILRNAGFDLLGQAPTVREAICASTIGDPPEVVVVLADGTVDEADLEAQVDGVRGEWRGSRIVVIAPVEKDDEVATCIGLGVDGLLHPATSSAALVHSLRLVALGENVFPTRLGSGAAVGIGEPATTVPARLAGRDFEILACLTEGYSNRMIAQRLQMPDASVKSQLRSLLTRLGLRNRTQAALWALEHGIGSRGRAAA